MSVVINGTTGITNDGGYTGDGVVFADTTPANTLVTTTGGNVGVGTVPGVKLDVKPADLGTTAGNTSYAYRATISSVGNTDQFDALWYRTASASGWTNADFILQRNVDGSAGQSKIVFGGSNYTGFWTNSAERARIDSSGNLLVGETTGANKLKVVDRADRAQATAQFNIEGNGYNLFFHLDGTAAYIGQNSNGRVLRMYSGSNAAVGVNLGVGGNSWGTYSDERVKDIIEPIENGVEKLSGLRTVVGKYKFDETNKRRVFLIAQDVQKVLPEAVIEDTSGDLSLQYQDLIPVLVKAIQEQQALITALTARVAALEGTQP